MDTGTSNNLPHFIAIGVALFGGITNYVMDKDYTWGKLIVSVITAGFAGYLIFLLGRECGFSENVISILCGISGLSGETALRIVKKVSTDYLKKKLLEQTKEK